MTDGTRIYLDNAATSFPKPSPVVEAVRDYLERVGAAAGRGGYAEAAEADRLVGQARQGVGRLLNGQATGTVVFGFNGTDVLNLAILGILRPGDHVVTTVCEHNSVLRPLQALVQRCRISVEYVACDRQGRVRADDVIASVRDDTRLVVMTHASNVTGALLPVAEVVRGVADHPAFVLVDAAQTLGHIPVNVAELGIDLLAASGHKGLLGPLGSGVLYIRHGVEAALRPLRYGGTGSHSDADQQPQELPDKYESGNPNVVSLAGLAASTRWLSDHGVPRIAEHEAALRQQLWEGFDLPGVTRWGPEDSVATLGVVSISIDGYDPQEVAAALDAESGVQVRAGLHCAPRMHRALTSHAVGGTIRFSVSHATTPEEVSAAVAAVARIAAVRPR